MRESFLSVSRRSDSLCNFLEISPQDKQHPTIVQTFYPMQNQPPVQAELHNNSNTDQSQDDERQSKGAFDEFLPRRVHPEAALDLIEPLRLIYRHYATLYFIFICTPTESQLGILDLIQVFVEALDRVFNNVCELDLIFHLSSIYEILDELIQGDGYVCETSLKEIVKSVAAAKKYAADTERSSAVSTTIGPQRR